jgi:MFS family permease
VPTSLTTAVPTADTHRLQRRTIIILVISQVVGTVGVGIAPSIGVLLASEVTDNEAWAGLARTFSTLGAAVLGLPLGNLAARFGRRVALSTGWGIAAVGSALLVFAAQANLWVPLFVGLLFIGAGSAVSLQSRFAATDLADPRHKAKSLALVVWVGTLGNVLGPNLGVPGKALSNVLGLNVYASAFLIAAVCLGLAGALIFVLLRPDPLIEANRRIVVDTETDAAPRTDRPTTGGKRRGGSIGRIFAELKVNRAARYAFIAIITAQIVMVSIMTMTPVHMEQHGGTITLVGITISLHIAGMYALSPVVGIIADRYGHRFTIGAGIAIFLISLLISGLMPDSTGGVIAALILLGLGWSFVNVSASALFASVVSADTRASAQGGVDAMSNLCGATAAFIAGPLLVATSFSFLSIVAAIVLVPLALMTLLRRRKVAHV